MKDPPGPNYRRLFLAEIVSHVVALDHVFSRGLRDVALTLCRRGVSPS
jgi:hypothetical protein